jgi:hypothetical protein
MGYAKIIGEMSMPDNPEKYALVQPRAKIIVAVGTPNISDVLPVTLPALPKSKNLCIDPCYEKISQKPETRFSSDFFCNKK